MQQRVGAKKSKKKKRTKIGDAGDEIRARGGGNGVWVWWYYYVGSVGFVHLPR
jgi:hypothetical protein